MTMSRRGFLAVAGGTGAALTLTNCGSAAKPAQAGELLRSKAPLPEPFKVPLPIPPVKKPIRTDTSADYYRVVQRKANLEILPGLKTEVMGYDGLLPGPRSMSGVGGQRSSSRSTSSRCRPSYTCTVVTPRRRVTAGRWMC